MNDKLKVNRSQNIKFESVLIGGDEIKSISH